MGASTIEWTEHTWNVTVGCSKVSPGCDNCYAIGVAHRRVPYGGTANGRQCSDPTCGFVTPRSAQRGSLQGRVRPVIVPTSLPDAGHSQVRRRGRGRSGTRQHQFYEDCFPAVDPHVGTVLGRCLFARANQNP